MSDFDFNFIDLYKIYVLCNILKEFEAEAKEEAKKYEEIEEIRVLGRSLAPMRLTDLLRDEDFLREFMETRPEQPEDLRKLIEKHIARRVFDYL